MLDKKLNAFEFWLVVFLLGSSVLFLGVNQIIMQMGQTVHFEEQREHSILFKEYMEGNL